MTTAMIRASGTIRLHPESASQVISLQLWIVPREARSQRRRRSSRSSCRRNAYGIQVPITRQSIATTSGGHSAILVAARRTRSQWTKNPKTMTKGTKRTTQSSRMLQRPSTSSSGEMETSVPGGRSCPSSRWHRDHSVGQRFPSHSLMMISGQVSQSPVSSPWSWIR
jgi:hypothetical protein